MVRLFCTIQYIHLPIGSTSRTSNYYGVGIGPVQVATVQCSGTETDLQHCSLAITSTCGQSPNAGVTCVGMSDTVSII